MNTAIFISLIFGLCRQAIALECGKFEYVEYAGPICERTCANPAPLCNRMLQIIEDGYCQCEEGYVFLTKNIKICVPLDQCIDKCGEHAQVSHIGPPCEKTCEMPEPACNRMLQFVEEGFCQCEEGYVFLSRNDKVCVPVDQCEELLICPEDRFKTECYYDCGICETPNETGCEWTCNAKKTCQCPHHQMPDAEGKCQDIEICYVNFYANNAS